MKEKILNEIRRLRIDILQAELNRIGLFPTEKYAATLVDKINAVEKERAEDLAKITTPVTKE